MECVETTWASLNNNSIPSKDLSKIVKISHSLLAIHSRLRVQLSPSKSREALIYTTRTLATSTFLWSKAKLFPSPKTLPIAMAWPTSHSTLNLSTINLFTSKRTPTMPTHRIKDTGRWTQSNGQVLQTLTATKATAHRQVAWWLGM